MTKERFYYNIVQETKRLYGNRVADCEMWYDDFTGIFDGWACYIIGIRNHVVNCFQGWENIDGTVTVVRTDDLERNNCNKCVFRKMASAANRSEQEMWRHGLH